MGEQLSGEQPMDLPVTKEAVEDTVENKERWSIKDFKGFIHFHSWEGSSCGKDDIRSIKEAAQKKTGLEYVGFAEHVGWPGEEYWYEKIRTEFDTIDEINGENGPKLFKGVEVNVFSDGSIDAPKDILERSDLVVASIHYKNTDRPEQMTAESTVDRWVTAMDNNPQINILGHPLRDLPKEEWGKVDWDQLCQCAASKGVAIEVGIADSAPEDLPQKFFEALKRNNNLVSLAPDFHRLADYLPQDELTEDQKLFLDKSTKLRSKIANFSFNEGEILRGRKLGEAELTEEEKRRALEELKASRAELQAIEESEEFAGVYATMVAAEYKDVQRKDGDGEIIETRRVDKKHLPYDMLLKYARRIYQIQGFIDRSNIINLWDAKKIEEWIKSRNEK